MTALSFINSSNQEQVVHPTYPLPAAAIDGYTSAQAFVVTINGGNIPVTLSAKAGKAVDLFNNTGVDLEYTRSGASVYFPIPNGTARLIPAIGGTSSTIAIRRIDQSGTAVSLVFEVLS